jgi:hypothetical protein
VIVIVAVEATEAVPAATVCDLIVPARPARFRVELIPVVSATVNPVPETVI